MNRRRLLLATALVPALALLGAPAAHADPAPPVEITMTKGYWACLVIQQVNIATCIDNPLPDASQLPSIPGLLGG